MFSKFSKAFQISYSLNLLFLYDQLKKICIVLYYSMTSKNSGFREFYGKRQCQKIYVFRPAMKKMILKGPLTFVICNLKLLL